LHNFEEIFENNKLPNIRELNLNNNMMQSLKSIGFLPTLKILRLRGNKIETLFVKPVTTDEKNFRRGLFGVLNIEFLDVSSNQLTYLYGL
jgi:Leucine-rich repeat (LRR) protein